MNKCHDCGCEEGQLHKLGCDMERCPFCGHQLISCDCIYAHLGYNHDWNAEYSGLPKEVYENGVSDEEEEKWADILYAKGRIPYIRYPVVCAKCGALYPDLFMVPDEEWEHYIELGMQRTVICRECYDNIKSLIDGNAQGTSQLED